VSYNPNCSLLLHDTCFTCGKEIASIRYIIGNQGGCYKEVIMSLSRYTIYAILVSLLAGIATLATWQMGGWPTAAGPLTYVSFICWAAYFLFGANPKDCGKAFLSIIVGIIGAIIIFVLALAFGFSPWWAVPLAVFIIVIFLLLCGRVPLIGNVPAIFLGAGLYFSLSSAGAFVDFTMEQYLLVGGAQLFYVLVGFVAGWLTIQLNNLLTKKEEEPKQD